jgi:K+-transporting ATPase ATPase C chain
MLAFMRPAVVLLGVITLTTGAVYPLAVTGAAQALFPTQANGSLLCLEGRIVGSNLIGQEFRDAKYFWGRPSATGPRPYDAGASMGSNLGPSNPALSEAISQRVRALRAATPASDGAIPVDLVTRSASGLDPHISPAAALFQVSRVAKARGLPEPQVRRLVEEGTEGRVLGLLGEPRVNVLRLNLALDAMMLKGSKTDFTKQCPDEQPHRQTRPR